MSGPKLFTAVCFLLLMPVWGCERGSEPAAKSNLRAINAAATTGMVADVVRNVAGTRAQVKQLIGSGVDPHLYRPTRSDIAELTAADIVFYNGLLLEGRMTDALMRIATGGRPVYAVSERLDEDYLLEPAGFAGHFDPHVWMDPLAWARTIGVVRDALIKLNPEGLEYYQQNAADFLRRLEALNDYAVNVLGSVPANRRVLVTAHDAFNYFARRYDFKVLGIQGISTESEAGVRDIERIVDYIVTHEIPAVFIESTISARNIKALIEGAAARNHKVEIGGSLFSDAMGPPGTYEGTYIGMIDHNVTTIARALGGAAPDRGMQGKLAKE